MELLPPNSRLGKVIGVLQIRKVLTQSPYPPGNMGAVSDIDIPVREPDVASETRVANCYTRHSSSRGHVLGSNDAE